MSRSVLAALGVFLVVIRTGYCLENVSTNVTSNDRVENVVIDTLVAKSEHEKLENFSKQFNSTNLLNVTTTKLLVSENGTLIFNKTEVNALEKPIGVFSLNGDLAVTSESFTVPGNLVTSDDLEDTFRDGSNETVPWWRRRPYPLRQMAARPCQCKNYLCGCCAGIDMQRLNISQKGCLKFKYDPDEFAITMKVVMNDRTVVSRTVSGKNPPPLCIPLPSPVAFIPRVEFCTRMFNVFTPGRNLHMCLDFQTKINSAPVLELQFDCLRMGADGFALVKPDAGGGLGPDVTGGGGGEDYETGGGVVGGPDEDTDYDPLDPEIAKRPLNATSTTPAG